MFVFVAKHGSLDMPFVMQKVPLVAIAHLKVLHPL